MNDRQNKLVSLLTEFAATFVRDEASSNPLITVTRADVSPDLAHATIFISVFPEKDEAHALVFLKRKGGDFRQYVAKKANFKHIPYFDFQIDVGEKNRRHLDGIASE